MFYVCKKPLYIQTAVRLCVHKTVGVFWMFKKKKEKKVLLIFSFLFFFFLSKFTECYWKLPQTMKAPLNTLHLSTVTLVFTSN